jgi:hypothetical protein
MDRRLLVLVCSVAMLGIASVSAAAQQKTAKQCNDEWTANKADIQASGKTKKVFIAECRGTAPPAAAAPAKPAPAATAAPAAPKPATTSGTTKPTGGHEAEVARERACGKEWKADKAAGKIAQGMTWPKYWSECDKRKKAAGM